MVGSNEAIAGKENPMRFNHLLGSLILLVLCPGCGGGGATESGFGDAETEMLARTAVEITAELAILPLDPTRAQVIVNAAGVWSQLSRVGDAKRSYQMKLARAAKIASEEAFVDSGCISQSDDTITYAECELTTGEFVNGEVSSSGGALTLDLRVGPALTSQDEGAIVVSIDGTITITDAILNGTLRYCTSEYILAALTQIDLVDADYEVTFDNAGCPSGGRLSFDERCEGCELVSVAATFGPSCGDVTLR
jgi:hypothetical protein